MRLSFATILIVLFFCAGAFYLPAAHADPAHSQILSVDYPRTVPPVSRFAVTVQVAYSGKFGMMDIGIWDSLKGVTVQSIVSNVTQSGAGRSSFTFNLTAPSRIGSWKLSAITRVWFEDAWFLDSAGTSNFTMSVVEIAFMRLYDVPQKSLVRLDEQPLNMNGPTLIVPAKLGEVHQLEVSRIIGEGTGQRAVFDSWSDGIRSNPRKVALNGNISLSPVYRTQYFLMVSSDIGVAAGQGWYDQGQVAQFGLGAILDQEPGFLGLLTEDYQFASWSGDTGANQPVAAILMNGPKSVEAKWAHTRSDLNINGATAVFLLVAVVLCIRALRIAVRQRSRNETSSVARFVAILILLMLFISVSANPRAMAQLPTPSGATVVSIGDASWYYWNQPGSDTCILWLGGGVEYSAGGYLINPYEYESFGTIRFLQELEKYYCLVALARGPYASPTVENRTIHMELAQGDFAIATQLHQWINSQGYSHVFLIGYSVGTDIAASVAAGNPHTWTGADGLILITAWLPSGIISGAPSVAANLLVLYGHAPEFEPTGLKFYQDAPGEGPRGTSYFHKEFHLLDNMTHEVWAAARDNTYSPIALGITVNFIEKSKALQLSQVAIPTNATLSRGNWTYQISVHTSSLRLGEPLIINATLNSSRASSDPIVLAAYDSSGILSAVQSPGGPLLSLRLVMPAAANQSAYSFSLVVLQKELDGWTVASSAYPIVLPRMGNALLEIRGLVPNSTLTLDRMPYKVPSSGQVEIVTSSGAHMVEALTNVAVQGLRATFLQWSDSSQLASRTLEVEGNTSLSIVYRIQYYVEVASSYGSTSGTGWYDANSTMAPSIQPPAYPPQLLVFTNWNDGKNSYDLGIPIPISSPMTIHAVWFQEKPSTALGISAVALLTTSILICTIALVLNLRLTRKQRSLGVNHG